MFVLLCYSLISLTSCTQCRVHCYNTTCHHGCYSTSWFVSNIHFFKHCPRTLPISNCDKDTILITDGHITEYWVLTQPTLALALAPPHSGHSGFGAELGQLLASGWMKGSAGCCRALASPGVFVTIIRSFFKCERIMITWTAIRPT